MSVVEIVMRGEPVAWARAGHHGAVSFTPTRQKQAMRAMQYAAGIAMGDRPPFSGSLSVSCIFAYPWPKAMSQKRRKQVFAYYRASRPDLDNLIKLIGDSFNNVVWQDDAQIAEITARKIYSDIPEVRVTVHLLSGGYEALEVEKEVDHEVDSRTAGYDVRSEIARHEHGQDQ